MDLCGNTCGSFYSISAIPPMQKGAEDGSYNSIKPINNNIMFYKNDYDSYDCSYVLPYKSENYDMYFESVLSEQAGMVVPGPVGPVGPVGPAGPAGPAGPMGPGAMMYKNTIISLYNNQSQTIPINGFVEFDNHHVIIGNSFHAPGTSEWWIWTPGLYLVNYNIYHVEPCQIALYKNDTFIVNGSSIGSIEGTSQSTITFVLKLGNDDCTYETGIQTPKHGCKLQLINKGDNMISLMDAESTNNGLPQVSATLSMVLLHK